MLAGGRFPARRIGTYRRDAFRACWIWTICARLLAGGPPALVSVMLANNETGAVQPVAEAGEIVHAAGGLLHVDAIQAFGKMPFDINALEADLVTLSAHKIGGPKGVGAVVLADGLLGLEPLLRGGGQELGRRAGTENVAGIAGFGAAAKAAMAALEADARRLESLRNRLESGLRQSPEVVVFSDERAAAAQYHAVYGSRPQGRDRRDRLRPRRYCGILGLGLFLRQGSAVPCAGSHGIWPRIGPGSGAAQSGLVHVGGGH